MRSSIRSALAPLPLALLVACTGSADPPVYGAAPPLPEPQRGLLPSMKIAEPALWGDRRPQVPEGYRITAIATDLQIPRQTLVLPNCDILIAEGRGGGAPTLTPKDVIAGLIKARGTSPVKGGNRLTLLRDADDDGVYESRTVFAKDLNAPYGLALVGNQLYVANQDALVRFDYQPGQFTAAGPPVKVADLPSAINHHWTKSLTASADGKFLYVGIGSNSNITERGMPCARRTRPRSRPRSGPTTLSGRTSLRSVSPSRRRRWGRGSRTVFSSASTAAGTATRRAATVSSSCRSATGVPPATRWTS